MQFSSNECRDNTYKCHAHQRRVQAHMVASIGSIPAALTSAHTALVKRPPKPKPVSQSPAATTGIGGGTCFGRPSHLQQGGYWGRWSFYSCKRTRAQHKDVALLSLPAETITGCRGINQQPLPPPTATVRSDHAKRTNRSKKKLQKPPVEESLTESPQIALEKPVITQQKQPNEEPGCRQKYSFIH